MTSLAATCLALAVFFEARGEPDLGKQYTAHIVQNWSDDEKVSTCDVILNKLYKEHFSFSLGNKTVLSLEKKVAKVTKHSDIEKAAWERAVEIGRKVNQRKFDITQGAKYFNHKRRGVKYKTKVKPRVIGEQLYY